MKFLIMNGPNLDQLGKREPLIYGKKTLEEIQEWTNREAHKLAVSLDWFQSNGEGELINHIHRNLLPPVPKYDGLIINPGGYAHTSIALLDALMMVAVPIVEIHLSNIYKRESFRQNLLTARASTIIMGGVGSTGPLLAVQALLLLRSQKEE